MSELKGKIDFTVFISVKNANPNGDPLDGNRPRTNNEGYGEISDVCIKRKIRNRFQDLSQKVFVQSDDRSDDGCAQTSTMVLQKQTPPTASWVLKFGSTRVRCFPHARIRKGARNNHVNAEES